VQGFLHCKPIPADEIMTLVARNQKGDANDDDSSRLDVVDNLIAFRKDKK
jgi:hypothetical protein